MNITKRHKLMNVLACPTLHFWVSHSRQTSIRSDEWIYKLCRTNTNTCFVLTFWGQWLNCDVNVDTTLHTCWLGTVNTINMDVMANGEIEEYLSGEVIRTVLTNTIAYREYILTLLLIRIIMFRGFMPPKLILTLQVL